MDLRWTPISPSGISPTAPAGFEAYRRIAAIQNPADAADVLDELIDRYGDPPASVSDLVNVSLVRILAASVGVYEVTQKKDLLTLSLEKLELPMIRGLLTAFDGRVTAGAGAKPYLSCGCGTRKSPWTCCSSFCRLWRPSRTKPPPPRRKTLDAPRPPGLY